MKTLLYLCLSIGLLQFLPNLQGQNYCNILTFDATKEWIAIVNFNSINNITGSDGGYGNYTNISTSITQGQNYPITLTPGFSNNLLNEYWKVYIDWNQNNTFDSNEVVFQSTNASNQSASTTITVPSGANLGSTRMRVLMRWNESPIDACSVYDFGEIEDYTLNIVANQSCLVEGSLNCGVPTTGNTIGANMGNLPSNCVVSTDDDSPTHWYVYTGTGDSDSVSLTTCSNNTDYDTKLFVYSGDNCNNLNCITGNDEMLTACSHSFSHSQVDFVSVQGLTYYILVSGWHTAAGNYQLNMTCTPTIGGGGGGGNNGCQTNLVLNNNITDGTYQATNSVSSNGNINTNNNVNFQAGNYIDLLPNFNVPVNTDFTAKILNCTSSKLLSNDSIPFSTNKP